ncbi:MAG: T9SS type A sorting domain-containing protein [Chitinophagales bacterium]|nr:T9SS type A sorting domain-containing protein [Chitinophagales bacterium]
MKKFMLLIAILAICNLVQSQSVKVDFTVTNNPLDLSGFGFNTAFAFSTETNSGQSIFIEDATENPNCERDIKDPNQLIINYLDNMPASILRFPGGTLANYYHYGIELNNSENCFTNDGFSQTAFSSCNVNVGYGINSQELNVFRIGANSPVRTDAFDLQNNYERNYIFDLVEYVNALPGERPRVIFVINMLTHFFDPCNQGRTINVTPASPNDWEGIEAATGFQEKVEENLNAIRFLIENDIDVVGIEFGNEFYFEEYTSNNNARWAIDLNIQEYLNLSDFYYTALKSDAELNDIPIGAPININQPLTDVWTSAIINHTFPSTALGFDAVIPHYYFYRNENSVIPNNSELQLVYNQNGNVLFDFLNDYLTGENNFDIWLTEWAWVNNASNEGDFRNSFADASYNISMVNNLLRWNFEHENRMPINIHHNLFSPGQSSFGVLFYPNVSSSNILPNNNFYPFFLLNQIHNNFNLCDLTSNNSMIYTNILPSELNIIPYHNPTTNTITFLYANTSDNAVTLDQTSEVTIAGETKDLSELIISGTFPEMNYYDAASLSGDLVGNGTSTNGIMNHKTKNDNWLIPARSIGVITIPIDPCANAPAVVAADHWEDAVEICDLNECYEGMSFVNSTYTPPLSPPCMPITQKTPLYLSTDVWFAFRATSQNLNIQLRTGIHNGINYGDVSNTHLTLWETNANEEPTNAIHCRSYHNHSNSSLRIDATNLVVGSLYFISVDRIVGQGNLFTLCLNPEISNDEWQGAISLDLGNVGAGDLCFNPSYTEDYFGDFTTKWATQNADNILPSCSNPVATLDMWYVINVTSDEVPLLAKLRLPTTYNNPTITTWSLYANNSGTLGDLITCSSYWNSPPFTSLVRRVLITQPGDYFLRINADQNSARSPFDICFTTNTNNTSRMENQDERQDFVEISFEIVPNPTKGDYAIDLNIGEPGIFDLKIYNSEGKFIKSIFEKKAFDKGEFNIVVSKNELNSGLYLLTLINESEILITKQIIIQE